MRMLFLILISFNVWATDLSPWITKIEVPEKVIKLTELKDKGSIEYQILSYEVAIDLFQLAKANDKVGNTFKALHFMELATHLFPYRDDLTNFYMNLVKKFTAETNELIFGKRIACDDLKKRVSYLNKISPQYAQKINGDKATCTIEISHNTKSINDIDISQWMQTTLPEIKNGHIEGKKEENSDLFNQALIQKAAAVEEKNQAETIYTLTFPKVEIILTSLRVLGNFHLQPEMRIETTRDGRTFLTGQYQVNNDSTFSIEGYCRTITPYFKLPEKTFGAILVTGRSFCSSEYSEAVTSNSKKYFNGDWDYIGERVGLMREAFEFVNDDAKSSTPLFHLFPRHVDMVLSYSYKDGKVIDHDFKFKITSLEKFFNWMYMNDYHFSDAPEIMSNSINIEFTKGNTYRIEIKDIFVLKGLEKIEIKLAPKKMFQRLIKELKVQKVIRGR